MRLLLIALFLSLFAPLAYSDPQTAADYSIKGEWVVANIEMIFVYDGDVGIFRPASEGEGITKIHFLTESRRDWQGPRESSVKIAISRAEETLCFDGGYYASFLDLSPPDYRTINGSVSLLLLQFGPPGIVLSELVDDDTRRISYGYSKETDLPNTDRPPKIESSVGKATVCVFIAEMRRAK
jgi:hypothetical protein